MKRKWVIPDIHGCLKTLKALVETQIMPNKENDAFIFLGDYIDRGPDSKGVIDYIINMEKSGFKITCLKGNHEEFMIRAIEAEQTKKKFFFWKSKNTILEEWLIFGGDTALKSFNTENINEINPLYINWLNDLKYYTIEDDFIIVHAGINCVKENPFEDKHFMLWAKEFDIIPEKINNKTIIHGHVPLSLDFIKSSISNHKYPFIGLDNGCVYNDKQDMGNLLALDIHSMTLLVQHNIDVIY